MNIYHTHTHTYMYHDTVETMVWIECFIFLLRIIFILREIHQKQEFRLLNGDKSKMKDSQARARSRFTGNDT